MAEFTDRGLKTAACLVLLCLLTLMLHPRACHAGNGVEEVGIRLDLSGGMVGAETLAQVENALLDTVEVALLDQLGGDLDYITRHQNAVVQTLGEVIAPVLERRGFALEELMLEPGPVTRLLVRLHLAEQRVSDFTVDFYLLGNTPVIEDLTAAAEEQIVVELFSTLARTPYNDETWLSGLVTETVDRLLSRMPEYSGFEHQVLVQPGPSTTVAVAFTPRQGEQLVTGHKLRLRSLTIPAIRLHPVREQAVYYLQALVGAPTGFVEAKLGELTRALYQHLINTCTLDDQHPDASLELALNGCNLEADLKIDSERYILSGRARLALWEYTPGGYEGQLKGRAGVAPVEDWLLFFDATYYPGAEEVFPAIVAGTLVDYGLVAAGWDLREQSLRLFGHYDLTPEVYLSLDAFLDEDHDPLSEISLCYRVRDIYELQLSSSFDGEVYAAVGATF